MLVCLWRLHLWSWFFWPRANWLRTADFRLPLMLRRVGYSLRLWLSLALRFRSNRVLSASGFDLSPN